MGESNHMLKFQMSKIPDNISPTREQTTEREYEVFAFRVVRASEAQLVYTNT